MLSISYHFMKMPRWTAEHRAFAVKTFYKNNNSYILTRRLFRNHFHVNRNDALPSDHAIKIWVRNFEETSSALKKKSRKGKSVRTPENIETVRDAVARSPQRSARRHAVSLGISYTSLRRILHKDLHYQPYKIQIVQELNEADFQKRLNFARELLNAIRNNEHFIHNLWMSDEAHFHLSGFVNKQNFRYWANENPRRLHQKPLHSAKVTVWCAISSYGIIGPYFFEDDNHNTLTVNSERYVSMIETFLTQELTRFPQVNENTWFQQDGATAHTARNSMNAVNQLFPGRVMSKNGNIFWPPKSPDLTACDYFLWGYLKSRVYAHRPQDIAQLKQTIREEIERIPVEMLRNVMNNLRLRLEECFERNGRHLENIIFKT